MNEVIKVKGLTKFYNKIPVVNNLNLSIKKGTAFGLLGANGAGKEHNYRMYFRHQKS